jgi:hypothetical protein
MNDSRDLKQRLAELTDDALLKMVREEAADYRKEALDLAKAELRARGVDYSTPAADEDEAEDNAPASLDPLRFGRRGGCPSCGGPLRTGTLVGEKEVTIVFSENKEERFVLVSVCRQCGLVSLAVDLETEVGS